MRKEPSAHKRKHDNKTGIKPGKDRSGWVGFLDSIGISYWEFTPAGKRVLFSRNLKSMLGYRGRELAESLSAWDTIVHPDDRKRVTEKLKAYISGKSAYFADEYRLLCKDGTYKWVLSRGIATERTPEGRPTRLAGTHLDITARKEADRTLVLSEEKYRLLFENASDAIVLYCSSSIQFLDANPAALRLYGYSRKEFLRLTIMDMTGEPDRTRATLKNPPLPGEVRKLPLRWQKRKDGSAFPAEITYGSYLMDGIQVTCSIVRDITDQMQKHEVMVRAKKFFREIAEFSGILEQANFSPRPAKFLHDYGITRQEEKIVWMVRKGMRNKEIARALSIQETTVKSHVSSIFGKLGVNSRVELINFIGGNNIGSSA